MVSESKRFVIICGGECDVRGIPTKAVENSFVIAADSGYDTAVSLGVTPDLLVGDMDSIIRVPDGVEVLRVKAEKDDTDTMLAIGIAMAMGAEEIVIIGGGGGRADHWLSNVFMLEALSDCGIRAELNDGINRIFVLSDGEVRLKNVGGYFGLIALENSIVTATGCKYPLAQAPLRRTHPYAVSNEVTSDEAVITVRGKVIVVQSR